MLFFFYLRTLMTAPNAGASISSLALQTGVDGEVSTHSGLSGPKYTKDIIDMTVDNGYTTAHVPQIPPNVSHLLPGPDLSITQFLAFDLPQQPARLIIGSTTGAFSVENANEDLAVYTTCPVPTRAY